MAKSFYEQKCRICGCDWNHACNDHDYWFAEDLCSACAEAMKPILFNTPMVQAILENRKTNTRRPIKPQPTYSPRSGFSWKNAAYGTDIPQTIEGAAHNFTKCAASYQPGDILYVRETWGIGGFDPESNEMFVEYKADGANATIVLPEEKFQKYYEGMSEAEPDWHPSIHMPKEAARLFLRVKGVRAERLQDITEEQAIKEGAAGTFPPNRRHKIKESKWVSGFCSECENFDLSKGLAIGLCAGNYEEQEPHSGESIGCTFGFKLKPDTAPESAIYHFQWLWDSAVKRSDYKYRWAGNPWVWAISFERCEKQ